MQGRCGVARWGYLGSNGEAWIEWDWVEISLPGVVALHDPMALRCNLVLLDSVARPLVASKRRLVLANLVNQLDWTGPALQLLATSS